MAPAELKKDTLIGGLRGLRVFAQAARTILG